MGSSGKPKADRDGSYGWRYTFDSRGNIVEEINLDEKGNPAPDNLGIAKVINAYDDTWGNMIRLKNLSRDNQLMTGSMGHCGNNDELRRVWQSATGGFFW